VVELLEPFAQIVDVSPEFTLQPPGRVLEPVLLGTDHLHQLIAPGAQRPQFAGLLVRQLAHWQVRPLGIQRQHPRIERVSLGQLPHPAGEVPYPARIDQHHRQAGGAQRPHQQRLVAAGGFHHDALAAKRF
jgi:hypothetical protein